MPRLPILSFVIALGLTGPMGAQTAPEVIGAQIDAFRAGDFDTAFEHASPGIRRMFGTPETFGRMVAQGYPMVLDPAEVRYLDRSLRRGHQIQRVLILDRDGRSFLLEYTMTGDGPGQRVDGVRILPETGAGV